MAPSDPWSADDYERLAGFEGDWRDTWWNQDFLELMGRRWRLSEVGRMLDVGCGVGHWGQRILPLLAPDADVFGVDVESQFVKAANKRAQRKGLARYSAEVGEAEALPYDDNTFDMVTCQTVLIHVRDIRAALIEMIRVLKPGGLLAAVEPNNMACTLVDMSAHPKPSWEEQSAILQFQSICERGKILLGRGDSSVGDLLPGHFHTAGLQELQVFTNDRAPALVPPYDQPDQKLDLTTWCGWYQGNIWPAAGTQDDARTLFEAGGGEPKQFDPLWCTVMKRQQAFIEAAEARTLYGGRGFVTYLVSGRKSS